MSKKPQDDYSRNASFDILIIQGARNKPQLLDFIRVSTVTEFQL